MRAEETGGDEGDEVGDALRHVGCLLAVLEEIVVNWELIDEGKPYREWCVPEGSS